MKIYLPLFIYNKPYTNMKKFWLGLLAIFLLGTPVVAQDFKAFGPLFGVLTPEEKSRFVSELFGIVAGTQYGTAEQLRIFADLRRELPVANPTAGLDSLLGAWRQGRGDLEALLRGNAAFDEAAITAILGGYDRANAGWIEQFGVLQQGLAPYRDSLSLPPTVLNAAEQTFRNSVEQQEDALEQANQAFLDALGSTDTSNPANFAGVANNLLSNFGTLEIGAGMQRLYAVYYQEAPDDLNALLVRFGSTPNYQSLWGAEWDAWTSFAIKSSTGPATETAGTSTESYQGLLAGGTVSFQYRPTLPFANGMMRLIAGAGAAADVYIPTRYNQQNPATFNNRGFTTGFGPLVRLGFAVTANAITYYSYVNASRGYVLRHESYPFNSLQAVAGAKWKALHFRLLQGQSSWAPNDHRRAQYTEASFSVEIK